MARANLEGANVRNVTLWEKVYHGQIKTAVGATLTMDDDMPGWLFLTPDAARSVLLPPEAKGLTFVIINQATGNYDLTVKEDSATTTIAVVGPGQGAIFYCDGTAWQTLSDTGTGRGSIILGDVTAYTALAANSGKTHIIPDVTSSVTVTLPTPDEGLEYTFIYGGVAADAQNHIITGGAGNYLKGQFTFMDLDAGAGADELSAVYGNGSSHITFTMTTPANYRVHCISDGALWYITGYVLSNTACAFS